MLHILAGGAAAIRRQIAEECDESIRHIHTIHNVSLRLLISSNAIAADCQK